MTKRTTLPLNATATYNSKTDTVVITSDDPVLNKNRFRVNLRRNTSEDRVLRELLLSEEGQTSAEHASSPAPLPPAGTTSIGHLPIGVSREGQQVTWNPDRYPHLLVAAKDYIARSRVSRAVLAAAGERSNEWHVLDFTETPENLGELSYTEISGRSNQLKQEGVSWYKELTRTPKKTLVFIDAAETLSAQEATAMRRVLLLGPALGIQVVAVVADVPDWAGTALSLFESRLVAGEPSKTKGQFSDGGRSVVYGNHGEFIKAEPLGENAAIFGTSDGAYHQIRFHSLSARN